jgi:hypothetical protein
MKRILIVGLCLVTLVALIWISNRGGWISSSAFRIRILKEGDNAAGGHPTENSRSTRHRLPEPPPTLRMNKASDALDYAALSRAPNLPPPYMFSGGAGTGRVVDSQGEVLIASGKEMGIFGASVSPDSTRVLVRGSEGRNLVLTPATGEKLKLPVYPPGAKMLCMGNWCWINDNKLLGQSGVQAFDTNGKPVKTDNNISETRLYIYDITKKQLTEVTMSAEFTHALASVVEVSPDGHVHLMLEAPALGNEPDLGWFEIEFLK